MGLWNNILETVGWKAPEPKLSNEVYNSCFEFNRVTNIPTMPTRLEHKVALTPIDLQTLPLEMQKLLSRTVDNALDRKQKASLQNGGTPEELDAIRTTFPEKTSHFILNPETKEFEEFRITVKKPNAPEENKEHAPRAPQSIELGNLNLPTETRFPSAEASSDNKTPAAGGAKGTRQVG